MSFAPEIQNSVEKISSFVKSAEGLELCISEGEFVAWQVTQTIDGRCLVFEPNSITEVLCRKDSEDKDFLQINFISGLKVLLTNHLVGFKPLPTPGLDLDRLPRVVTTPDLMSVEEAISEALSGEMVHLQELEVLKLVYESVLCGGETVGFDLTHEREWYARLQGSLLHATA